MTHFGPPILCSQEWSTQYQETAQKLWVGGSEQLFSTLGGKPGKPSDVFGLGERVPYPGHVPDVTQSGKHIPECCCALCVGWVVHVHEKSPKGLYEVRPELTELILQCLCDEPTQRPGFHCSAGTSGGTLLPAEPIAGGDTVLDRLKSKVKKCGKRDCGVMYDTESYWHLQQLQSLRDSVRKAYEKGTAEQSTLFLLWLATMARDSEADAGEADAGEALALMVRVPGANVLTTC